MNKGYIKLDRAIENWRFKTKPNYVALWVHLLLEANHQDAMIGDVQIKRGQLLTSLESLKKGTGLSLQQIRTIFNKLNNEEITIKSTNKYTLITIVNYDKYQGGYGKSNKQTNKQKGDFLTINQQTTNKQLTTNKNNKNVNKNNNSVVERFKYLKDKWLEAGYDANIVDTALNVCKQNLTEENMKIVMNILTTPNITNPMGYIQTLKKEGVL